MVSYFFPPGEAVGGLRWAGLTRYLSALGWEVEVLCASRGGAEEVSEIATARGITITPIRPHPTALDAYRSVKRWFERRSPDGEGTLGAATRTDSGANPPGRGILAGMRRLLRRFAPILAWPDEGRGWVVPARSAIRRAVRRRRPDLIISTGPPHSVHLATALARIPQGVPWVTDFRDPWHLDPEHPISRSLGRSRAETKIARALERTILRRASAGIATTLEIREALLRNHPGTRVHWIPNGIDLRDVPASSVPRDQGFSVIHLGSLYHRRDPTVLLEGLRRFRDRATSQTGGQSIVLRFVGEVEGEHRRTIERELQGALAGSVELLGHRPRHEALAWLQRSHLAVVLAQDQGEMVPAKLYESVALGVPTLVVTEPKSATGRAAERFGLFVASPDDPEAVADALAVVESGGLPSPGTRHLPVTHDEISVHLDLLLRSIMMGGKEGERMARRLQTSPFEQVLLDGASVSGTEPQESVRHD